MKETTVRINKIKSYFFQKIKKNDKPLARLNKKKRENNQTNQSKMKKERLQQTMQKYERP